MQKSIYWVIRERYLDIFWEICWLASNALEVNFRSERFQVKNQTECHARTSYRSLSINQIAEDNPEKPVKAL